MPGFTTHYLFGQQAYGHLAKTPLKQTIQKNHTAFALGLQGPDIFFYDILSLISTQKNPGSIAHTTDTREFLKNLLKSTKIFPTKKEQEIAKSYVLGFIGHYLLDTACHPYIYAMTHYNDKPKGYMGHHIRLETDIDTTLLWFYQRRRPSDFRQSESIALSKEQRSVISTALFFAFQKSYPGLKLHRHRITQAIYSMQKGTKLLYDPTGHKKTFIRRMENIIPGYPLLSPLVPNDTLIFHKDPCNMNHKVWQNPWNEDHESDESFFDLFEEAELKYISLLNDIGDFFSTRHTSQEEAKALSLLLNALGSKSYHSGLLSASHLS